MMKSITAAAMLFSAAAFVTPASAAPSPAGVPLQSSSSLLMDVQYKDHDRREHRRRYRPGHRYDEPPPRWRRYHRRPYDWRRRGCIIVGPVWFCP